MAIREKALGPEHPETANSLNNLAVLYSSMGDYAKAEPLYRRALAICEKALGPEHPDTATSLNSLAAALPLDGRLRQSRTALPARVGDSRESARPRASLTATSLNNLAGLYQATGDYAKAEPLYRRALAIREKALGPEHPDTAASLNNLAELYRSMGDYAKAEPLYRRALAIHEKALGPEHPDTATSLNNLAGLYHRWATTPKPNRSTGAHWRFAKKRSARSIPTPQPASTTWRSFTSAMGDYAKAEPLLRRALAIQRKSTRPGASRHRRSLNNLAFLNIDLGKAGDALEFGRARREGARNSARQYSLLHLRTTAAGISRDNQSFHACGHAGHRT